MEATLVVKFQARNGETRRPHGNSLLKKCILDIKREGVVEERLL